MQFHGKEVQNEEKIENDTGPRRISFNVNGTKVDEENESGQVGHVGHKIFTFLEG